MSAVVIKLSYARDSGSVARRGSLCGFSHNYFFARMRSSSRCFLALKVSKGARSLFRNPAALGAAGKKVVFTKVYVSRWGGVAVSKQAFNNSEAPRG